MTIETFEKAKELKEKIDRLYVFKNILSEYCGDFNLHRGYMVQICLDGALYQEIEDALQAMIDFMESEFEKLGDE